MNVPTEIIAGFGSVLLAALIKGQRDVSKRIQRLERNVLTIVVMLRDRGFHVPAGADTDILLKAGRDCV